MDKRSLHNIIGHAIRDADNTLFGEDYQKQATAVTKALADNGMTIIPNEPSERLLEFLVENMPLGRMTPEQLMQAIYMLIVSNAMKLR